MNGLRCIPLINGVQPSWANLEVNIGGFPIVGITKITYSDKETMNNIYGLGQHPVARGYGNIESTCSITLLRSTVERLRHMSLTGRLQDIKPFDIVVCFIPINGSRLIIHKIRNCQFLGDGLEISQGDTKNEQTFEILPSHIEWH
ncbi:MAG: hypothetical protein ACOX4D_07620 [Bacteroidales bacterium]|jgi:hypothetical protein